VVTVSNGPTSFFTFLESKIIKKKLLQKKHQKVRTTFFRKHKNTRLFKCE